MDSALNRIPFLSLNRHLLDLLASRILRLAISASLAALSVLLAWSLFPHEVRAIPGASNTQASPLNLDPVALAQSIVDSHLFGRDDQETAVVSEATAANIRVDGLLYSDDAGSAWAILQVDGKAGIYKVGDMLPDGETLAAIAPTAIQLIQGISQRIIELQKGYGNPASGILLAGDTGLMTPRRALFPGESILAGPPAFKPVLQPVAVPQGADPLTQLRSLRQQLIKH